MEIMTEIDGMALGMTAIFAAGFAYSLWLILMPKAICWLMIP